MTRNNRAEGYEYYFIDECTGSVASTPYTQALSSVSFDPLSSSSFLLSTICPLPWLDLVIRV